jgi:Protein of unknown function (DUF3025)
MAIVHRRGWSAEARHESPWYFALRTLWDSFAEHTAFPSPAALSELYLQRVAALPELAPEIARLRFVAAQKPRRRAARPIVLAALYEGQIVERGEVPTRVDDWHDFFNALTFAAFPHAKWALHRRQYELLARRIGPDTRRLPGARTREQDALALFDEGGIALAVSPEAARGQSQAQLVASAPALCRAGKARAVPFGHALHEHLIEGLPCPLGTVHALVLEPAGLTPSALLERVDQALAADLARPALFLEPSPERGLSLAEIEALQVESAPETAAKGRPAPALDRA